MQNLAPNNFWKFDITYWLQKLNSSDTGVTQTEAEKRLFESSKFQKPVSSFEKDVKLFIGQFKSALMLMLIGAVILSAFLGDISDVYIILFILLSTGTLSFFQERNAGKVVEKLQSLIQIKCTVLRDGEAKEIASNQIIPGDVLLFKAGDMVPADCLIIEANELHANEASLTGESFPARKEVGVADEHAELSKRNNCLWQGTNIVSGNAKALVIATGNNTIFSSITKSVSTTKETSFEKGIKDFGYLLMKITLVLSIFILFINIFNHKNIVDSALFALALAVGMAPELLPAITTIAMSAGAKRMLSKKVIVKKLSSIQNLGEVNLLCTDKTGTITEGVIEVSSIINGLGNEDEFVKELAYWNAMLESGYTNPIDESLKALTIKPQYQPDKIGEVPYDFIRKRLSIAIHTVDGNILISKGAFTETLAICNKIRLSDGSIEDIREYKSEIENNFTRFGFEGLRSIGIAYKNISQSSITKEDECEMIFAGFILLHDPVKIGITDTILKLKELEVDLKIITGDNRYIAKSIASKIGIDNPVVLTGGQLTETSPEAIISLVRQTHIFAEVEPQQKEQIIRALRKNYTVAYMGDGINDVAAINAADVGISVDNAVDVAREAADFVLMEKKLSVITEGIEEGRKTFANTLKYIFINTGATFGNMISVAFASLILPFLPMLPKQILLTNFITDFPYLSVASDKVDDEQLKKPGKWDLKLIRNYMIIFGIHSSIFDLITFVVLLYVLKVKESAFQTGWFIESVLTELFVLFIIRTHKSFTNSVPGKPLLLLSILGLIITLGLPYMIFSYDIGFVPLPLSNLLLMILIVIGYVITADFLKKWFFKKYLNT